MGPEGQSMMVNHLKKALGKIWPKRSERGNNYPDVDKKSAINKKINSQIKKPHLKMIPIKDKKYLLLLNTGTRSCLMELEQFCLYNRLTWNTWRRPKDITA